MRFVIDNNQLAEIANTKGLTATQKRRITLVLPPLVWAEALHPGAPRYALPRLTDYNLWIGKDVSDILADAVRATDAQLRTIETIVARRSARHRHCVDRLRSPAHSEVTRAVAIKQNNRADMDIARIAFKESDRVGFSRQHMCLDSALEELAAVLANTPFCPSGDGPATPARTFADLLASGNPPIVNFVRYHLSLYVAYHRAWRQELRLNTSPPSRLDHVPDMTLPLYAGEGDVIVTADAFFHGLFRMAEPRGRIRVNSWHECLCTLL